MKHWICTVQVKRESNSEYEPMISVNHESENQTIIDLNGKIVKNYYHLIGTFDGSFYIVDDEERCKQMLFEKLREKFIKEPTYNMLKDLKTMNQFLEKIDHDSCIDGENLNVNNHLHDVMTILKESLKESSIILDKQSRNNDCHGEQIISFDAYNNGKGIIMNASTNGEGDTTLTITLSKRDKPDTFANLVLVLLENVFGENTKSF